MLNFSNAQPIENNKTIYGIAKCSLLAIMLSASTALAAPQLNSVQTGGTYVSQMPGEWPNTAIKTQITQTTDRGIVHWNSFNTTAQETVNFSQPNASSVTLNRIVGGGNTLFNGDMTANGQVWFVSPNNIVFGTAADVNVGGLIMSNANISNQDFLSGQNRFTLSTNQTAEVANHGRITTGDNGLVAMIGPKVHNSGSIRTGVDSNVILSAAHNFEMSNGENGKVVVNPLYMNNALQGVIHDGSIQADGSHVQLQAITNNNLLDNAINVDGQYNGFIRAQTVGAKKGSVTFDTTGNIYSSTDIDVSGNEAGETGGNITMYGKNIHLEGNVLNSEIDASGHSSGGDILIGEIARNQFAETVTIDDDVEVNLSADVNGDGGTLIAYGTQKINASGTFTGRGGIQGGDGASVNFGNPSHSSALFEVGETDFTGVADLTAANGETGTVFIASNEQTNIFSARTALHNRNNVSVGQTLDNGTNVRVRVFDTATLHNIDWSGDGNLWIEADRIRPENDPDIDSEGVFSRGNGGFRMGHIINRTSDISFNQDFNQNYVIRLNSGDLTFDINGDLDLVTGNTNRFTTNSGKLKVNLNGLNSGNASSSFNSLLSALGDGNTGGGTEISLGNGQFTGPFSIGNNNITLSGAGRDNTTINGSIAISGDNVSISDLTVAPIDYNQLGGIFVNETAGGGVYNSRLLNGNLELRLTSANGFEVIGNEFTGLLGAAVGINFSRDFTVSDNTINGAATGVLAYASNSGLIENNVISNFTETGIRMQYDTGNTTVANNNIAGGAIGVADVIGGNNTIKSNTISDSILYGVYVEDTNGTKIENNSIDNAQSAAIAGFYTENMLADNNTLQNSKTGIQMREGISSTFTNNTLSNLANSGISLYNGSNNSVVRNNDLTDTRSGTALLAHNSSGVRFEANTIENMEGTEGVDGAGISTLYSENGTIAQNVLNQIAGNGIEVVSSNNTILRGNTLSNVKGGKVVIVDSTTLP